MIANFFRPGVYAGLRVLCDRVRLSPVHGAFPESPVNGAQDIMGERRILPGVNAGPQQDSARSSSWRDTK